MYRAFLLHVHWDEYSSHTIGWSFDVSIFVHNYQWEATRWRNYRLGVNFLPNYTPSSTNIISFEVSSILACSCMYCIVSLYDRMSSQLGNHCNMYASQFTYIYYARTPLTHWPLLDVVGILKLYISNLLYRIVACMGTYCEIALKWMRQNILVKGAPGIRSSNFKSMLFKLSLKNKN